MAFHEEDLDLVLVPSGLLLMFGYHLFLLYRYIHLPHTTAIGFINSDAKAWAERIMKQEYSNRNLPLSVISSNVSAATYLATVSLTLSSLIGTWIASNSSVFQSSLIYGDRRSSTLTMKYISILICFLLAFSCFVHSTRKFVHANYLITMPNSSFPIGYVETPILRGNEFWWLGLRALYFALDLLMWFFGPIPMFVSSAAMVLLLQSLDFNSTPLHRYDRAEKKVEEGVDRTGIALAALSIGAGELPDSRRDEIAQDSATLGHRNRKECVGMRSLEG